MLSISFVVDVKSYAVQLNSTVFWCKSLRHFAEAKLCRSQHGQVAWKGLFLKKHVFLFCFKVILFCFSFLESCLLYSFKHDVFKLTVLTSKQNTSKQKNEQKKDGLELQSGTVSNIYLLFVSSGVSVFCELFTPDTLEVRGEMGVNISVSTLQVSTHCLKVDWIFWKCAGYVLMPLKKKKSWCCETGFNFVSLGLVKKCTQHDETRFKTIRLSYHHAWEKPTWECDLEQILLKMYWCF